MADKKISQLTGATTPLAGSEVLPIVQSGNTVKVSVDNLTAGKSVSASSFVPTGAGVPTNGIFLGAANSVSIATNSTEHWMVNASGNLNPVGTKGIGTNAAPVSELVATTLSTAAATAGSNLSGNTLAADGTDTDIGLNLTPKGAGNVAVTAGNLVISTAAKGVDFSANTHAAGMTSELLDWYEEGTWTPVCSRSTGGNITAVYEVQQGKYTRIGNLVTVSGLVVITSVSAQGSGENEIKGLPFNPADNSLGAGSVGRNNAFTTDVVRATWAWGDGRILFSSNVNSQDATAVDWKSGYVNFSLTYFV